MALKKGSQNPAQAEGRSTVTLPNGAQVEVLDRPEVPLEIPRHKGDGRPKIRIGSSAKFYYAKRASKYGEVIENKYLINKWKIRAAVFGMTRTPALVRRGQAVLAFEDKSNPDRHAELRQSWEEIASEAIDVARTGDRAAEGTALHTLSELADQGADLSHLDATTMAAVNQWRRIISHFEILATESFVVDDEFGVGGSFDRLVRPRGVMRGPDGEVRLTPDDVVIVDLKSNQSSKYFGAGYRVQQRVYSRGTPYVHVTDEQAAAGDTGRRPWPGGQAPNQQWALIPHVPLESPADAGLMWVDLTRGQQQLELAAAIYADRAADKAGFEEAELPDLGEPAAPEPGPVRDETVLDFLLGRIASAPNLDAVNALYDQHAAVWTDECTDLVTARMTELKGAAA